LPASKERTQRMTLYARKRYYSDDLFRISSIIRGNILASCRRTKHKNDSKTQRILGCKFSEFKCYIESKFEPWMNWDNHGNPKNGIIAPNKTWDMDHIIPLHTARTIEDVYKLNHYTNYQPLCTYKNRIVKRTTQGTKRYPSPSKERTEERILK